MLAGFRSRLTFANVVSLTALFFALGGGTYALTVPRNIVGPKQIKKNAVRSKHIKARAVKRSDLGSNAVNSAKVADASLTGADLLDGSIGKADLAAGSVGTGKLADNAVKSGKVADRSLIGADLGNNSVTGTQIDEATLGVVPGAATAVNASNLGGVSASDYVRDCTTGAVKALARVNGASVSASLGSTGVTTNFSCNGQPVLAKRLNAGIYQVVLDDGNPNDNTLGTSVVQAAIALPTSAASQGSGDPALSQCALSPPPVEPCFNLSTANGSGTLADTTFLVVMY
jgi:hypothetical protein